MAPTPLLGMVAAAVCSLSSLPAADEFDESHVLWEQRGEVPFGGFGSALARVADVDGDGVDDLAIGSDQPRSGDPARVSLFSGIDGRLLWSVDGPTLARFATHFGSSLAAMGDLNGDGVEDLAVGAFRENSRDSQRLRATGAIFLLSGVDGSTIRVVRGTQEGGLLGLAVLNVGDVDGDGMDDFAGSAPGRQAADGVSIGAVLVFSGQTGLVLHRIDFHRGTQALANFGFVLDRLADIDGDGIDEIVVSSPFEGDPAGPQNAGAVRAYSGASGVMLWEAYGQADDLIGLGLAVTADRNGDGVPDVAASTNVSLTREITVFSGIDGALLPALRVSDDLSPRAPLARAGDPNADGVEDLLVGMHLVSGEGPVLSQNELNPFESRGVALGDLDQDGFEDYAISDPIFEQGLGFVRVHRGARMLMHADLKSAAGPIEFRVPIQDVRAGVLILTSVDSSPWHFVVAPLGFSARFGGAYDVPTTPPGFSGLQLGFRCLALSAAKEILVSPEAFVTLTR